MSKQDWNQSQYYQEDFLASHSVQPGSDEAKRMTVTSGLRCLELYRRSDHVGSYEGIRKKKMARWVERIQKGVKAGAR